MTEFLIGAGITVYIFFIIAAVATFFRSEANS